MSGVCVCSRACAHTNDSNPMTTTTTVAAQLRLRSTRSIPKANTHARTHALHKHALILFPFMRARCARRQLQVYLVFRSGGKPVEDTIYMGAKASNAKFITRSQPPKPFIHNPSSSSTAQIDPDTGERAMSSHSTN